MKIMTPMGSPTGFSVIFPQGLVGWSYPFGCFKILEWLSALMVIFDFWIDISKVKN